MGVNALKAKALHSKPLFYLYHSFLSIKKKLNTKSGPWILNLPGNFVPFVSLWE